MARHSSVASFLLMALLVTTAAAMATTTTSATDAGQEKGVLEYMGREYMVFVYPPRPTDPIDATFGQYCLRILKNTLGIRQKQAEKILGCTYPTGFTAKLTPAQVFKLRLHRQMAPHPCFPLLDMNYDNKHRAHFVVDEGLMLKPLRTRVHHPMKLRKRYLPYLRQAGFLPLARLVAAGAIDAPALTALVDRWWPETHTFHLPCGELIVTLQDVATLMGLPINGAAVTDMVQPDGWRDVVQACLGLRPPEPAQDEKDNKPTGVSSKWLVDNFSKLPQNAPEDVVERYARAWLWHLMGGYLFPDGSGPWNHGNEDDTEDLSTVAYLWKNCINVVANAHRRYIAYSNEFDVLTQQQVTWDPYAREEVGEMQLSSICRRDHMYWRIEVPLIFFYIVEWHLPQRVMWQFGRLQPVNVPQPTTNQNLHKIEKRKQRGAVNWAEKHEAWIHVWETRHALTVYPSSGAVHRANAFSEYQLWLQQNSRLKIRPPLNPADIADLPDSGSEEDVAEQMSRLSNEAGEVLRFPQGSKEELSALRAFATRVRKSCHRLAIKMNCIMAPAVHDPEPVPSQSRSSRPRSRGDPHGKAPRDDSDSKDSQAGDESTEGDSPYQQDTLGASQLEGAPGTTQEMPQHRTYRRRKELDSGNVLPTNPGREKKKKRITDM
ncbi:hypothetical protein QOZ80_7BG0605810 [Eleusine coracana subsp. coracana]|nr:hypothetical protein QOZ80_7BG0605810 [Eleusine coracana subsp. coracana]